MPTPTRTTPRRYASLADAATYVGVDPRTVRRWIADGRLPVYRVGPKLLRVDLAEVDQLARPVPAAEVCR